MLFRPQGNSVDFVAIGVHRSGLSYAYRKGEGAQAELVDCGFRHCLQPVDFNHELSQLGKKFKLNRIHCGTYLSGTEYRILLINAPKVPDEEIRDAVRWQLINLIDLPIDEISFDVFEVSAHHVSTDGDRSVFVVVTEKKTIAQRVAMFSRAGIKLQVIDIPEMLQRNIACVSAQNDSVMFVSIANSSGLITFSHQGTLYMSRQINVGMDCDASEQTIEKVVVEIQRSLDYFECRFKDVTVVKILVLPLVANPDVLLHYLAQYLTIPSYYPDMSHLLVSQSVYSQEVVNQCFYTLGAALRNVPETT